MANQYNLLMIEEANEGGGCWPQVVNLAAINASADPKVKEAAKKLASIMFNDSAQHEWKSYEYGLHSGILAFAYVDYPCTVNDEIILYSN